MNRELRIGNYVEYDNRIFEIHSLSEELPTLNTIEFGIGVVDWNNIKPLPITPDALFKLGAKEVKERLSTWYDLQVGDFDECMEIVEANDGHWCIELISVQPRGFEVPRHFHFIHEIQNLYFDLTGEQLKFEQ